MRTAATTLPTSAAVRSSSVIMAEPPADLADLAHGAAHVDVDGGDAERFEELGRGGHFFRHGAEELDGEGRVGGVAFDELERLAIFLQKRAGVNEVGGAKADAAELADDEAKRKIGISRQRR